MIDINQKLTEYDLNVKYQKFLLKFLLIDKGLGPQITLNNQTNLITGDFNNYIKENT